METTQVLINRLMDKEDVVHTHTHTHTHNGTLLSHEKNKIMPFAVTWTVSY